MTAGSDKQDKECERKEYERWKDYANALMLALTVLFAGPAIGGHDDGFSDRLCRPRCLRDTLCSSVACQGVELALR